MPILYPPLALIERELFGPVAGNDVPDSQAIDPDAPAASHVKMPDYLLALVERRVAADRAYPPESLAVGQIRRVTTVPTAKGETRALGRTCAFLLGNWAGGRRWSGWMVAQETDYATDRDMVLQDDDGAFAPEAAMVQTWNAASIELRGDEAILGKLSAERLGAVLKLTDQHRQEGEYVASRPGRIGAWDIDGETTVVTGTPLDTASDPRKQYQQLYRNLAMELEKAAVMTAPSVRPQEDKAGWLAWLRDTFVRPAWTFAALAVVVFQSAWILSEQQGWDDQVVYRSTAAQVRADACLTRIRIVFKLDTSYADLIVALRRVDATLINGPSETGEIWILPPPDQDPNEIAAMLKQSHLVEQADIILPQKHLCKR